MPVKSLMDVTVNFKASQALIDKYERWWRANGFGSRSDFLRQSADAAMANRRRKGSMMNAKLIIETNLHLGRIGARMMEINTRAANCNTLPAEEEFLRTVKEVLRELTLIRKKVS